VRLSCNGIRAKNRLVYWEWVTPTQDLETVTGTHTIEKSNANSSAVIVNWKEDDSCSILAQGWKSEWLVQLGTCKPVKLIRDSNECTCTITVLLGTHFTSSMDHSREHLIRIGKKLMSWSSVDAGDNAYCACVTLKLGVIQALFRGVDSERRHDFTLI